MSKTSVAEDSASAQAAPPSGPTEPPLDQLIVDPDTLFQQIERWRTMGYHVLTPATRVQRFAPNWGASVSMVLMDARVDYETGRGTDCYFDPGQMNKKSKDVDDHERGISRVGLQRITRCAGISWDPTFSVRVDTRTIMHLWEFRAVGVGMDFDGQPFTLQGTKEVDLRDESAQIGGWTPALWKQELADAHSERRSVKAINGWSDRRVLQARAHGLQLCETKAMERAIRSIGLQHVYTVKQLKFPFVVVKAAYLPDMKDPEIRQMVAEAHLRGTRALFAPQQSMRPVPVIDITPKALPEPLPTRDQIIDEVSRTPRAADVAPASASEAKAKENKSHDPVSDIQRGGTPTADHAGAPPVTTPSASSAPPVAAKPSTPGAKAPGWRRSVTILDVKELKAGPGKHGRWVLTKIEFGIGESGAEAHTTLDEKLVARANEFRTSGALADVLIKEDGDYLNVAEIEPAGAMPSLFEGNTFEEPQTTTAPPPSQVTKPVAASDLKW